MSTGFLITSLPGRLKRISDVVNQHVLKKLYIYVSVSKNQSCIRNNEWVSKRIVDMYSSSFQLFPNLDVRIILNELKMQEDKLTKIKDYNVDVIIVPKNFDKEKVSTFRCLQKDLPIVYVDDVTDEEDKIEIKPMKMYNNVVLGGTFDRIHTGHKILLSEALLRCMKKLTVGVTDGDMIKGKKLWELIEPCTARIKAVETFIKEVDGSVEYEVVPITDMYGPTKCDPNLNMIVVSLETQKGGCKVNEVRKQNGLNELDIHVVDLAQDSKSQGEEEEKISSSNIRMRLLGTHIKPPEAKPNLSAKPYIIGLTGGIASGKSSICEYLREKGVSVIDCDKIAHQLYKPGSQLFSELVKLFGERIVSQNGEINRKELGSIVFSDANQLQKLNCLMWPAILKSAKAECERLYTEDKVEIVILEAAVLVRAGWYKSVHEVWATILPQKEAINRIINRNNLTEEEAKLRIEAQPSNTEIVEIANVIFCSLWSYEFTRQQVDKAWTTTQALVRNN